MFDTVRVKCPYCSIVNELQTKSGACILGEYDLVNGPPEVLLGVAGNHECERRVYDKKESKMVDIGCGKWFNINVQCMTKAWIERLAEEEEK